MALARWQATIVDDEGNVVPNASVEVRIEVAGQPLATIFSDRDGSDQIANPMTADGEGFAAFHVPGGAYRIRAFSGGFERIWRYVGIGTGSEHDLGNIFFPRGPWDVDTTYSQGDLVSHSVTGSGDFTFVSNDGGNLGNEPSFAGSPPDPESDQHWTVLGVSVAGTKGDAGDDGDSAYVYIAYASADDGTDFTLTFNAALDYIAVLATGTEIVTPEASDFAGLWKNYKGATGSTGADGSDGDDGWSPVFSIESDGDRRVLKIVDWVGGEGTKPPVDKYVGVTGLEDLIANGVDIRGTAGDGAGNVNTTGAPVTAGNLVQYNDTSGDVIEDSGLAASGVLVDPMTTRGDIIYRGASSSARLAAGTEGHVLTMGADDPEWAAPSGGGGDAPTVQVFTSSGTWTKPDGLKGIKVTVQAGGGGGGGAGSDDSAGGGGGGGGTAIKWIAAASLGSTETVTVGALGAGGSAGNNAGSNGGTSSFGSHCSATGGEGGAAANGSVDTDTGGTATGGDVNLQGQHGAPRNPSGFSNGLPGGGDSFLGNGGAARVTASSSAGLNATGYGGGGGGGMRTTPTDRGGGDATAGIVIVEEYY